jgi:hypothetical protein
MWLERGPGWAVVILITRDGNFRTSRTDGESQNMRRRGIKEVTWVI